MKESLKLKIKQLLLDQGIDKPDPIDEKSVKISNISKVPPALLKNVDKLEKHLKTSKSDKKTSPKAKQQKNNLPKNVRQKNEAPKFNKNKSESNNSFNQQQNNKKSNATNENKKPIALKKKKENPIKKNNTKINLKESKSLDTNTKHNNCLAVKNVPNKKRKSNENIGQTKKPKLSKFTNFNVEPIEIDLKLIKYQTNKSNKKKLQKKKKPNEFIVTEIDDVPTKTNGNDSDSYEDDYIDQFFMDDANLTVKENGKNPSGIMDEITSSNILEKDNDGIASNCKYDENVEPVEMEDESKSLVPASKKKHKETLYSLDPYEYVEDDSFSSDEYSDDYSDLSSNSDYDYSSDDDDDSFDSGSFHTESDDLSTITDYTDDTYDRFMKGQYESDPEDGDYTTDDIYIRKGDANMRKIEDYLSLPFSSDNESLQIIDLDELEENSKSDSDSSCPELVPIHNTAIQPAIRQQASKDLIQNEPTNYTLSVSSKKNPNWKEFPILLNEFSEKLPESFEINRVKSKHKPSVVSIDIGSKLDQNDYEELMNIDDENVSDSNEYSTVENNNSNANAEGDFDVLPKAPLVSPKFFNALNSRHVLMILKDTIYFHGILKIKLLVGNVEIVGYKLRPNEMVTAYSPRGHSFIYLTPLPYESSHEIDDRLNELKSLFLQSDLDQVKRHFVPHSDAIVLLEKVTDKPSAHMIKKYMKQVVFPNTNVLKNYRQYYSTEFILSTKFLRNFNLGVRINEQWQQFHMNSFSRFIIAGGKGVGKSTLVRYLLNRNLEKFSKILLIDLDIGQPELFVSQTISATIVTEPILGAGYLHNFNPIKSFLYGHINPVVSPVKYFQCVLKLLEFCMANDECKNIPWIINTMGYCRGFGLEIMMAIVKAFNPTNLIQIKGHRDQDNFDRQLNIDEVQSYSFHILENETKSFQAPCDFDFYVCDTMTKRTSERLNKWDITPKDLRYITLLSKLGNILQGNAQWLTDVKPLCASLDDLQVLTPNDDLLDENSLPALINGCLVYLCHKPLTNENNHSDDVVECFGIGIVRNLNFIARKVYLLPAIPHDTLSNVNALAISSVPIPVPIIVNQRNKIRGQLPYVYSTDEFIGSKQVVQISYRPDNKQNKHVKLIN